MNELIATIRPRMIFMLEERKIPREVIAQIASLDITTTSQFARTGRNDDDFAQWLEEDVQAKKLTQAAGHYMHAYLTRST